MSLVLQNKARGEGKHQTWSRDIDEDDLSPAPDTWVAAAAKYGTKIQNIVSYVTEPTAKL